MRPLGWWITTSATVLAVHSVQELSGISHNWADCTNAVLWTGAAMLALKIGWVKP